MARAKALAAPGAALPLVNIKVFCGGSKHLPRSPTPPAVETLLSLALFFKPDLFPLPPPRSEMKASYSLSITSGLTDDAVLAKTAPGRLLLQSDAENDKKLKCQLRQIK